MIVRYTGVDSVFVLDESDAFNGFAVDAAGSELSALGVAFQQSTAGKLDAEEALVSIEFVKQAAGELAQSSGWQASFEGMLGYARTRNWVSEDGQYIRSHIENLAAGSDPVA